MLTFHDELSNSPGGAVSVGSGAHIAASVAVLHAVDEQLVARSHTGRGRIGQRSTVQTTPHHVERRTTAHLALESNPGSHWFLQGDGADGDSWATIH